MNKFIYELDSLARQWWSFVTTSSVQLALFIVIIWAVGWVLKKQSARLLYWLWLIGLFKVFVPPVIALPSFLSRSRFIPETNISTFYLPQIELSTALMPGLSYPAYLFIAWLLMVAAFSAFWWYQLLQFQRQISQNTKEVTLLLQPVDRYGEFSHIRMFAGPNIPMPFTKGLFNPRIFLPESLLGWPRQEQEALILHELAHIQRRDLVVIAIQNIIQLLYFFHPGVWLANIQLARYREQACDDWAIQKMHGNSLVYGRLLLKAINQATTCQPIFASNTCFHQSRKFLLNRFHYILKRKEHIMAKLKLSQRLLLVGLLVLGIALSCQRQEQPSQPKQGIVYNNVPIDLSKATLQAGLDNQQKVDYDVPPMPAGGFEAIGEYLLFPEFGKEIGSVINLQVNEKGELYSLQYKYRTGDKAQLSDKSLERLAIHSYEKKLSDILPKQKWTPAQKDGKPIAAWITAPIQYVLKVKPEDIVTLSEVPPPPPPMASGEGAQFVPYDEPPSPIGGFKAIQEKLVYPELARKAGIEGTVLVYAQIGVDGQVLATRILQSLGENNGCDEAAMAAIKATKFVPAKQKNRPVPVWVSIPVRFKLHQGADTGVTDPQTSRQIIKPFESTDAQTTPLVFDQPPEPIDGFPALQKNLIYPDAARKAGIEGKVAVQTEFDTMGNVVSTNLLVAMDDKECNDAAIAAIKSVKWKPAMSQGKPVAARVVIPIMFKLK